MDVFLVEPQNQGRAGTTWEPSHEWWLAKATSSSWGFRWFTKKLLGSLVDPQNKDRRTENGGAAAPDRSGRWVWSVWPVRSTGLTGVQRSSPETSKRRTRVEIARLASRLSKFAVTGHPSDGAITKVSEFSLEEHVSLLAANGILDFQLPPYNPRGERMEAISWNPSSLFSFFPSYFP
jgi:hypothetical protein